MATRREITKKYAADYAKSSKNAKVLVRDERFAPNAQALTEAIPEPLRKDEVEPASDILKQVLEKRPVRVIDENEDKRRS
ncbi:hypothetical protein SAMN04487912_104289 [Arthrobacter sp. cf158]|nr:hypothetical protein SAMN04487912_104289 [Arthrobacter sp. cf158]